MFLKPPASDSTQRRMIDSTHIHTHAHTCTIFFIASVPLAPFLKTLFGDISACPAAIFHSFISSSSNTVGFFLPLSSFHMAPQTCMHAHTHLHKHTHTHSTPAFSPGGNFLLPRTKQKPELKRFAMQESYLRLKSGRPSLSPQQRSQQDGACSSGKGFFFLSLSPLLYHLSSPLPFLPLVHNHIMNAPDTIHTHKRAGLGSTETLPVFALLRVPPPPDQAKKL